MKAANFAPIKIDDVIFLKLKMSGVESVFLDHYIFTEQGWKKAYIAD